MGGHGHIFIENALAAHHGGVLQMTVDADALAKAFGHDLLGLHIDELILQRGAAGVDNKNFHYFVPFYCKCFKD